MTLHGMTYLQDSEATPAGNWKWDNYTRCYTEKKSTSQLKLVNGETCFERAQQVKGS